MKLGVFVSEALLAGAELAEVLTRLRHDVRAQLYHDAPDRASANLDVKVHLSGSMSCTTAVLLHEQVTHVA